MTMNAGIARALRRFAGGSAVMIALLTGIHAKLYPHDPELPSRDVDRIVVTVQGGGSHEVTDRRVVTRVIRLLRSSGHSAIRPYDRYFPGTYYEPAEGDLIAALYHGTEPRGTVMINRYLMTMGDGALSPLGAADSAELQRLLRAGTRQAPSREGDRR